MQQSSIPHTILGNDFIDPSNINDVSDLTYSRKQRYRLMRKVPRYTILKRFAESEIACVSGPPRVLCLREICNQFEDCFPRRAFDDAWFDDSLQEFAGYDKVNPGWFALGKYPLADSLGQRLPEQRSLLSPHMFIPNVAQIVWVMALYKELHNHYLFKNEFVRTSSRDSSGNDVIVGASGKGIFIGSHPSDETKETLGIAVAYRLGR